MDCLECVKDEATFLEFVRALVKDREEEIAQEGIRPSPPFGPGARGWENGTIEAFLEAAAAWAEDTSFGDSQGLRNASPWKRFAVFLMCGKIYE